MAVIKLLLTDMKSNRFLQTDNNPPKEEICTRLVLGVLFFSGSYCISNHVSVSGALKGKKNLGEFKIAINSTEHWQQFCSTFLKITCYICEREKEKKKK